MEVWRKRDPADSIFAPSKKGETHPPSILPPSRLYSHAGRLGGPEVETGAEKSIERSGLRQGVTIWSTAAIMPLGGKVWAAGDLFIFNLLCPYDKRENLNLDWVRY